MALFLSLPCDVPSLPLSTLLTIGEAKLCEAPSLTDLPEVPLDCVLYDPSFPSGPFPSNFALTCIGFGVYITYSKQTFMTNSEYSHFFKSNRDVLVARVGIVNKKKKYKTKIRRKMKVVMITVVMLG